MNRKEFLAKAAAVASMPFAMAGQRALPQAEKVVKWEELSQATIYQRLVVRGPQLVPTGWNIPPQLASRSSQIQVAGYSIWANGVQSAITQWNGSLSSLMDRMPATAEKFGSIIVYFHP